MKRGERNSPSEVDYIISVDSISYPFEVKSRETEILKTLISVYKKYSVPSKIKISTRKKQIEDSGVPILFYIINEIKQYIKQQKKRKSTKFKKGFKW